MRELCSVPDPAVAVLTAAFQQGRLPARFAYGRLRVRARSAPGSSERLVRGSA